MSDLDQALRARIITACQDMTALGINQGTSGNISARSANGMLITPSATPYATMTPEMIATMPFSGTYGAWEGPKAPSTEWRFHFDILQARPEIGAVVHAHPAFATSLAITRRDIPACHYMIAAFGGDSVRCAGYARFGSAELSALALAALEDRTACLLANHGVIVLGETLDKALWRAVELETLAKQYCNALLIGDPVLLSADEVAEAAAAMQSYGLDEARDGKGLA